MWYIATNIKKLTFHFNEKEPSFILIFIVGLVPPHQEMRGKHLDVAPVTDLVAPYSQKTDTEQQLDLAKLHDEVEDSNTCASYHKVLLLIIPTSIIFCSCSNSESSVELPFNAMHSSSFSVDN